MHDPDNGRRYFDLFNEIGIIAQLSRAVMERRMPDGLSLPHFSVLNHFVRLGDGKTPGELARAFQVPKNSMTNTLAGLERRGLIDVRPSETDARSRRIFLTDAGRDYREAAIAAIGPDIARLAATVSPAVIDELLPRLAEVRRALDENRV
jgi:DNA-binding MarR family transcriptional regulator